MALYYFISDAECEMVKKCFECNSRMDQVLQRSIGYRNVNRIKKGKSIEHYDRTSNLAKCKASSGQEDTSAKEA